MSGSGKCVIATCYTILSTTKVLRVSKSFKLIYVNSFLTLVRGINY